MQTPAGRSGELCENEMSCPSGKEYDSGDPSLSNAVLAPVPCAGQGECKWGRCFCRDGFEGPSCSESTEAASGAALID